MVGWEQTTFLDFSLMNSNETLIGMSKYRIEAETQTSCALVSQSKQGSIFSYHIFKITKVCPLTNFGFFKDQVSKQT